MIEIIFKILVISIICFFPILIWGYVFSYFENSNLNTKKFLSWIIAWWISVFPVLFIDSFFSWFLKDFNIFYLISELAPWIQIFLSISIIWIIVAALAAIFWWVFFTSNFLDSRKTFFKNILIFLGFSIIFVGIYLILWLIPWFNNNVKNPLEISWNIFNTLRLLISYYLVIGFVEELSKHFNFLSSSLRDSITIKKWVLYSIFVALGFWFVENIFYVYTILSRNWLDSGLFTTFIFRSIFSLSVHIICSVLVWYYFIKAYKQTTKLVDYIKVFFVWILIWIFMHWLFDVMMTLGITIFIFLYFIFNYMYTTGIFYKEEEK